MQICPPRPQDCTAAAAHPPGEQHPPAAAATPAAGKLRLRVAKDPATGQWANAEVLSVDGLGYGSYNWKLAYNPANVGV
jgi:hypothetical protein